MLIGQETANAVGVGGQAVRKSKHMGDCSLYKLPRVVLLEKVTMGLGSSVEKLSGHLFSASLTAGTSIFAVLHLYFLYQPAWVLEVKVVLL